MDQCSLDPYEEQLYKVFSSHDHENNGSLDHNGLLQLCNTLQLQDKSDDLITAVLSNCHQSRATFPQFKDALLRLLGSMQDRVEEKDKEADREVAPKYVVGSKKYGRRSRPRIDDSPNQSPGIQRSNSTAEHIRKPLRLQRCTSVPSVTSYNETSFISSPMGDICTEDMLREAWRKLGVGEDGYLNQNELILVFEAIGLDKLTDNVIRHLSNKSVLDYTKKISFQELLEALQKDDTWSHFLGSEGSQNSNFILNSDELHHSKIVHNIKLGPDGSGFISEDVIIEMWESAGIAAPKLLLNDLGFKQNSSIDVQELAIILEKEIKSMSELRIDHTCNPLVALLQAFISIYQVEIKCLKTILQQMCEEKEKLKFDVSEANNRSTLLAQEVDENVLKMEQKAQRQVKHLETRHAENIRELSEQFSSEKEQMLMNNQELEAKIKSLESEMGLLHENLQSVQKYVGVIEGENKKLVNKVGDLEETKCNLEIQIDELEMEKLKMIEAEAMKSGELLETINALQRENGNLKDKNDEMISQIETLNREMVNLNIKVKSSQPLGDDLLVNIDGIGLTGAKRRNGELPTDEFDFECAITGSPRLGKMRKCHESKETTTPFNALSDNGEDNDEIDCAKPTIGTKLERKMNIIDGLLKKYAIQLDYNENSETTYTEMLELLLLHFLKQSNEKEANELNQSMTERTTIPNKNEQTISQEEINFKTKLNALEETNASLQEKCETLQQGLNLLRDEFEQCEDYWQKKLEDERAIYESDQQSSTDKLNEVLTRLTEYEEQFVADSKRLNTIEESACLENQYEYLEHEFDEFKLRSKEELDERESLISILRDQLESNKKQIAQVCDAAVQVVELKTAPKLRNYLIENTNFYPHQTEPNTPEIHWPKMNNQERTQSTSLGMIRDDVVEQEVKTAMPMKSKKNRRHVRSLTQPARNLRRPNDSASDSSDNATSYNSLDGRHGRRKTYEVQKLEEFQIVLERKCKDLQVELRNHKQLYEQLSKSYCRLYHSCRGELQHAYTKLDHQFRLSTKLQEKLAENDVLVGNLYIENAYLMKNNQRLEQQLNMITNQEVKVNF